jgi:hypothetical protein
MVPDIDLLDCAARDPRLQRLLAYWKEKSGAGLMPRREQIDPVEIPSLLPFALMTEVTPAGTKMRLLGTSATIAYGQETRGKLVSDLQFGEFTSRWAEAFREVVESALPVSAAGSFHNGASLLCDIEILLLPLSDNGSTVTHILGGLIIVPKAPSAGFRSAVAGPSFASAERSRRRL